MPEELEPDDLPEVERVERDDVEPEEDEPVPEEDLPVVLLVDLPSVVLEVPDFALPVVLPDVEPVVEPVLLPVVLPDEPVEPEDMLLASPVLPAVRPWVPPLIIEEEDPPDEVDDFAPEEPEPVDWFEVF